MPRTARIVIPGAAHHITQRGNDRQSVFFDDEDHRKYLELLRLFGEEFSLRVIAYCLMKNHIHVVGVPGFESSLSDAIGRTHQQYTAYFQDKYSRSGHLWQSRFFSCPMDEAHTLNALAYVELNPVRACITAEPWLYPWSSAQAHAGLRGDRLLDLTRWFRQFTAQEWVEALGGKREDSDLVRDIRRHTQRGKPWGSDLGFLEKARKCGA